MKRFAYFLIVLLASAIVDDAWATALALPSPSVAEENDEYLPAQRVPEAEHSAARQQPVLGESKSLAATCSPVRRAAPSGWSLTESFGDSSLYVFMSLQI